MNTTRRAIGPIRLFATNSTRTIDCDENGARFTFLQAKSASADGSGLRLPMAHKGAAGHDPGMARLPRLDLPGIPQRKHSDPFFRPTMTTWSSSGVSCLFRA